MVHKCAARSWALNSSISVSTGAPPVKRRVGAAIVLLEIDLATLNPTAAWLGLSCGFECPLAGVMKGIYE